MLHINCSKFKTFHLIWKIPFKFKCLIFDLTKFTVSVRLGFVQCHMIPIFSQWQNEDKMLHCGNQSSCLPLTCGVFMFFFLSLIIIGHTILDCLGYKIELPTKRTSWQNQRMTSRNPLPTQKKSKSSKR